MGSADAEAHALLPNTFRRPCSEGPIPYQDLTLVTLRAQGPRSSTKAPLNFPRAPIDPRNVVILFTINPRTAGGLSHLRTAGGGGADDRPTPENSKTKKDSDKQ